MKSKDFIDRLKSAAQDYKTFYVQGAFGAPLVTEPWNNVKRYTVDTTNKYNLKHASEIQAVADKGYFGFDCVCLVKGILWGWCGDANARYGGAAFNTNGVPDIGTEQIITKCSGVSTDFKVITAGELLWKSGHVGVYIGDGLAVECTPSYKGGVQITAVKNIGTKPGYSATTWTKHGKLPYVDYMAEAASGDGYIIYTTKASDTLWSIAKEYLGSGSRYTEIMALNGLKSDVISADMELKIPQSGGTVTDAEPKNVNASVPVIKKGDKCEAVKAMQTLLNLRSNAGLDVDGSCGTKSDTAIRAFQKSRGLTINGICDAKTWAALIG